MCQFRGHITVALGFPRPPSCVLCTSNSPVQVDCPQQHELKERLVPGRLVAGPQVNTRQAQTELNRPGPADTQTDNIAGGMGDVKFTA